MNNETFNYDFPIQRLPNSKKDKVWAAKCIDWVIAKGISNRENDNSNLEDKYAILNGEIPDAFYKKVLNPYNATNEKYKRFPATMRNYDMMKGIIRRYVSEYIKNPHEFIIAANNHDVVLAKNAKLNRELILLAQKKIATIVQQKYSEWINAGNPPEQFKPDEQIDTEAFIKQFNKEYIDDISAQAQELLDLVRDITDDTMLYAKAYFDFVTFGECYTYSDVIDNKLIKRNINCLDAFPVSTDNHFKEDDDMFACRRKMTYQQIIDEFDVYLSDSDKEFLNNYYSRAGISSGNNKLTIATYDSYFPDVCGKYNKEDRELFGNNPIMSRDLNDNLYDVWHVVWRGEVRKGIVTYINEVGLIGEKTVEDGYKLNKELGDISVEWLYVPQVYEGVRIGNRNDGVYPYGAKAIAFDRDGKLPYNGVNELIQGFSKFSIIDVITPYQVFYNIVAYHREMTIAKNKLNILLIAKSLLGKYPEDTIYKMLADGVLYVDDTDDTGLLRTQNVRAVNTSIGDYINQLSNLLKEIEDAAKNQVDMTPQRYGEIASYAGKGTTQEAVIRGSMGTVIVEFVMDCLRERDYLRDLDFTKLAWIDGLDTSYRDNNGNIKYISLNVDNHVYADYVIKSKSSVKEKERLEAVRQLAFSASQNGDLDIAMAAIEGDNIATISKLIKEFQANKEANDLQIKQLEQENNKMLQEFELQKIAAKGEQDRETATIEGMIRREIELIRADSNAISFKADVTDKEQNEILKRLNDKRGEIDRERLNLERDKLNAANANKAADRKLKEKDIELRRDVINNSKNDKAK